MLTADTSTGAAATGSRPHATSIATAVITPTAVATARLKIPSDNASIPSISATERTCRAAAAFIAKVFRIDDELVSAGSRV